MTARSIGAVYRERYAAKRNKQCIRCGVAFQEGDRVHVKKTASGHRKTYHEVCWEAMQI